VDVSSWPEASEAQRAGYRTAALDGLNFFYPGVSPAVMQRALQCVPSPCTSLTEAIGLHHALAGYDSADALAPLEAMVSSITCSNAALQQARRANPVEPAGVPTDPDRLEQYLDAGSGVSAR